MGLPGGPVLGKTVGDGERLQLPGRAMRVCLIVIPIPPTVMSAADIFSTIYVLRRAPGGLVGLSQASSLWGLVSLVLSLPWCLEEEVGKVGVGPGEAKVSGADLRLLSEASLPQAPPAPPGCPAVLCHTGAQSAGGGQAWRGSCLGTGLRRPQRQEGVWAWPWETLWTGGGCGRLLPNN